MTDDSKEAAIEAIARVGREVRPKSSRALWIAGLVLGAVGVAAFAVIFLVDPSASSAPAPMREGGRGFSTGLAIGLCAGIALGLAIARQRKR